MSNYKWMDQINWHVLTTTLNNLDADREFRIRGEHTIWSRRKNAQHHDWHIVSDPIGTLTRLRNLAKASVEKANGIIVDAVKYGYIERGKEVRTNGSKVRP